MHPLEAQKKFTEMDRHGKKRVLRLLRKEDLTLEAAMIRETSCSCGANYCGCGMQDLPYIKRDHYTCMHRLGRCSQKVADLMVKDKEKDDQKKRDSIERVEIADKKQKSIVQ